MTEWVARYGRNQKGSMAKDTAVDITVEEYFP